MRVSIKKSTGKLIESQSGGEVERLPQTVKMSDEEYVEYLTACDNLESGRLNTLKQNAINAGYAEADIEVNYITDAEFAVIMEDMKPVPTYADLRRAAYPPWQDYNDAKVKQASTDPTIQAEGLAQEQEYLDACLAVKAAFPKV